jgi:hypothetical protein
MERKKLLITGCGRSGTFYAAELWRLLGLDICHERPVGPHGKMGEDGAASWLMAANDPNPPFGPSATDYEFETIIHQVRHPLKVIGSVAQFILAKGQFAPDYIARNVPETQITADEKILNEKQQLILQAARYWYYWNRLAWKKATCTVQVENMEQELQNLCELLHVEYQEDVLENIGSNINNRHVYLNEELWQIDWEDLKNLDAEFTDEIQNLAASFGYNL